MASRRLPKQGVLGDFREACGPSKPKVPPGVVVKNGRWYVRVRYRGDDGRRHAAWRECAKNATDAKDVGAALLRELEEHGGESLRNARKTFAELAKYFEQTYLIPAIFVKGQKASGRRSVAPAKSALNALVNYFQSTSLRTITHGSLDGYKRTRLQTPIVFIKTIKTKKGVEKIETRRPRSVASVDRELELLRRMFTIAREERWMHHTPFRRSDPVISTGQENKRQQILSHEEEELLLAYCTDSRAHLRPLLICAIDTGMRWGEMIKTRVGDVNLEAGLIVIEATHTKTLSSRTVGITSRLSVELKKLCAGKKPGARVFEVGSVKTAWTTLRRLTGLKEVRWHDLRHTNATRIEESKEISLGQLGRHLGHANLRSTERYVNQALRSSRKIVAALERSEAAEGAARQSADLLDAVQAEREIDEESKAIN